MPQLPRKVIIIGAGVSGASAATELKKLGIDAKNILILEKKDYISGKLKNFKNGITPFAAEVLTHNYPIIDILRKKQISLEKLAPCDLNSVETWCEFTKRSLLGKFTYILQFAWQSIKFAKHVWKFNRILKNPKRDLPEIYKKNFASFAKEKKLNHLATFLKSFTVGFGYGPYDDKNNYAYRMLNYMGYTTIPALAIGGLVAVEGGYQRVIEAMLEDFNVKTSAKIQSIDRKENEVTVHYDWGGKTHTATADLLILTASPKTWPELNMPLTESEQACYEHLNYYRYPVAICRIKGLPAKHVYIPEALENDGLGHAAFLFTRDARKNPPDGRLFTVYINLPQGQNNYAFDAETKQSLIADIKKIPGVTDVSIEDCTIWEDYNPTIPWDVARKLPQKGVTLYLGAYLPESFETVACVETFARKKVREKLGVAEAWVIEKSLHHIARSFYFFTAPRKPPLLDESIHSHVGK